MHTRGKRQCIELIYPDNKTEQINCADWSFNWHIVSVYADDVAPIYPAGTVLHVISWHDNSASKGNPDPRNWVGSGQRTIDEMGFAWITWYDYTDDEYQAEFDARKSAAKTDDDDGRTASVRLRIADCGFRIADCGSRACSACRGIALARARDRSARRAVAVDRAPHQVQVGAADRARSMKAGSACPTAASTWCSAT